MSSHASRRGVLAALASLVALPSLARAEVNMDDSIEWRTVDSDLVVRARLASVGPAGAEVRVVSVLAGTHPQPTLRLVNTRDSRLDLLEPWRARDADLLLFLVRQGAEYELRVGGSPQQSAYELDRLNAHGYSAAALRANFTRAHTADEVLATVRAFSARRLPRPDRASAAVRGGDPRLRRLDVPPSTEAWTALYLGSTCYLVVPAP